MKSIFDKFKISILMYLNGENFNISQKYHGTLQKMTILDFYNSRKIRLADLLEILNIYSHFFCKNFMKTTFLLVKLLNS